MKLMHLLPPTPPLDGFQIVFASVHKTTRLPLLQLLKKQYIEPIPVPALKNFASTSRYPDTLGQEGLPTVEDRHDRNPDPPGRSFICALFSLTLDVLHTFGCEDVI